MPPVLRPTSTGSIRGTPRRDSFISDKPVPDTGSRPTSPFDEPNGHFSHINSPGSSRPGSPHSFNPYKTSRNSRKKKSSSSTHTSILASPPTSSEKSSSNSMDLDEPSTVTWDCATAVVENQQVHTTYEKPTYSSTGEIISYGKMITKTVTMTVTTTIASTEILHSGEDGYEASIERHKQQQQSQPAPNENGQFCDNLTKEPEQKSDQETKTATESQKQQTETSNCPSRS